jgi:hypothetical protein
MKARKLISNGVLYNARMFCTRESFLWEETGVPGENPRVRVGDHPYPLTYNHCRSRGSNSGRIGENPARYHCATRTPEHLIGDSGGPGSNPGVVCCNFSVPVTVCLQSPEQFFATPRILVISTKDIASGIYMSTASKSL